MKKYITFSFVILSIIFYSCSAGQSQNSKTTLTVKEFSDTLKKFPAAILIDVRTPEEYAEGHIQHAININWNDGNFVQEAGKLDKTKPVFVYCLSGGRSSSAASKMRSEGFKEVYELEGGLLKWRASKLPETRSATSEVIQGITHEQFQKMITSDKIVLIDFYAEWCGPCKKIKPFLDEISTELESKVIVIRINTEDNPALCEELKIDAIPLLQVYKNKALAWSNKGFIEKAEIVKHLQ